MNTEAYRPPYGSSASICFDCRRACGGCCWSKIDPETEHPRFQPVPGWTAEPSILCVYSGSAPALVQTWRVTACPLFLPGPPRKSDPGQLTEEQLAVLMRKWFRDEAF